MYYFAYGSNMNKEQMKERCSNAKFVEIAKITNYIFQFDGKSKERKGAVANIIPSKSKHDKVWGVIWEIDETCLKTLDLKEGYANMVYDRKTIKIEGISGKKYDCIIYYRNPRDPGYPSLEYYLTIEKGGWFFGLPLDYLEDVYYKAIENEEISIYQNKEKEIINNYLDELKSYIKTEQFLNKAKTCRHWLGADVAIDKEEHKDLIQWLEGAKIRDHDPTNGKNATITQYYKELSQLFFELKFIFKTILNGINKYYFYGSLIVAANKYLKTNNDLNGLLESVIEESKRVLDELYNY